MNLLQRRLVCIFACFLTIAGALYATPAVGQTAANYTDDGSFSLYTYISAAESISAYASDLEPDDLEYYSYYYVEGEPTWILTGSNYADSGEGASFTSGTVPPGSTYTATFYFSVVYYYYSNSSPVYPPYCGSIVYGEGDDCEGRDNPTGYASVYVPSPPPTIDQLSPSSANQGDRNTLTITGRYLVQDSSDQLTLTFTGPNNPNNPFTLVGQPSTCNPTCTATYSYDLTNTPPGQYQIYLANSEADSEPVSFTVNISSTSGPPPDLCAVSSKQAEGFTSIVPSGINLGISGNFSVSFGGSDFAGINPTVAYGPYSTPESIAASMAALITRNYAQYGLTAKAFGRNVIYSGTATTSSGSGTLGLVTNVFSGNGGVSSSFLENPSPTAANEAGLACESAPPPPQTSVCGPDPGPRDQINVPAKITQARNLLSPRCEAKFAVFPGYTTTKFFSTLNKANICQYPNHRPQNDPIAYAATYPLENTIDLLPDFYTDRNTNEQAITLLHEGIHLFGRGNLDDPTVQRDLGLPQTNYDTDNITRYILGGCNP